MDNAPLPERSTRQDIDVGSEGGVEHYPDGVKTLGRVQGRRLLELFRIGCEEARVSCRYRYVPREEAHRETVRYRSSRRDPFQLPLGQGPGCSRRERCARERARHFDRRRKEAPGVSLAAAI